MTELQWALLLLGAAVIVALIVVSRREREGSGPFGTAPSPQRPAPPPAAPAEGRFNLPPMEPPPDLFDEYGVSKPRKSAAAESAPKPIAKPELPVTRVVPDKPPPAFVKLKEAAPAPPEKIIALYVAEHEGTKILGRKIHAALEAAGLRYNGKKKAYDRLSGDAAIFSVTSLTAPGQLDPTDAGFSTPGLALFMRLPGPAKPVAALKDMLATADTLARSLKAVLFDAARKPLTDETLRALAAEVDDWAKRYAR